MSKGHEVLYASRVNSKHTARILDMKELVSEGHEVLQARRVNSKHTAR